MQLTVLGSGSAGNGYVLQNDSEALVIECGMPIDDCLKALDFNITKVCGCLVTHEHGDHARYIERYLTYMDVYTSHGTAAAIRYSGKRRPTEMEALRTIHIGAFSVRPIEAEHDAEEPFAFIIEHPEIGRLLFATDTYYIRYRIPGMNHILIECNYSLPILKDNVAAGFIQDFRAERTLKSHMNLENLKDMLSANDLHGVNQIVLLHLSGDNSNADLFKREIEMHTCKPVEIARRGLELTIKKEPF